MSNELNHTQRRETTAPLKQWKQRSLARAAGAFYLLLVIAGGTAHVVVRGKVYVPNDAAETARLVAQNANLVSAGILIDLIGALAFLMVGLTLYELLRDVHRFAARLMVSLVAIAVAMTSLNLIFQYGGVLLATKEAYAGGLTGQPDSSILFMFDLQFYGFVLVQAFTGPWLFPFGWLVVRSNMFPKAIGWLLMVGGFSYLADLVIQIMDRSLAEKVSEAVLGPAVLAEVTAIGYLLIRGVREDDTQFV